MKWQPIDTAPKDGTRVLLTDGKFTQIGLWCQWLSVPGNPEEWFYEGGRGWNDPTHWMPLPTPPLEEARDD